MTALGMSADFFEESEIKKIATQLLDDVNTAYINRDEKLLNDKFDRSTLYGKWAYEYAVKKVNYLNDWSMKQGIDFTDINSDYTFSKISGSNQTYNVSVKSIDQYTYKYPEDSEENTFMICVYHYMRIEVKKDKWVITKDWFSDPMCDVVGDSPKALEITDYIVENVPKPYHLEGSRKKVVAYANKYCGAQPTSSYNRQYRDYNSVGGDCANFASQCLFASGVLRKNSLWNYDKGGSLAWIKAEHLKNYILNSGRGSRIAVGNYENTYKAAYNLQPGDFIAYEEKGDIKHISIVTGYDSKGVALVTCHNINRYQVPWDIGWNRQGIRFWLIRMHF